MTRVAIMQPTYLPWSGYFGLMQSVDVFVLLDSVQFARRSWQQRNLIKTANGAKWLTVPVLSKAKRQQLICEVELDKSSDFAAKHRRGIEMSYAKTPYFSQYADTLLPLLNDNSPLLVDLTVGLILQLKAQLGIDTCVLRASELNGNGNKADLLASICKKIGATSYVSPPGSKVYLDESDAFEKIGVALQFYDFKHPEYSQLFGEFLPNMSIVDMLFNCGERASAMLKGASEVIK